MANSENLLNQIDHIVVLMLENRSFDNVLGWLYNGANQKPFNQVPPGQTFEGLTGKECNPRPGGGESCVGKGTVMTDPYPDPNEPYDHVFMQLYNYPTMPYPIPNLTNAPDMQGFVIDYANAISQGTPGTTMMDVDPGIIMNCFTPDRLPVISGLANAYAVCDHWFSSVPTQTFPNRSFIHAATSSGNVLNMWKTGTHLWDVGIFINKTETIYNRLHKAGVSWKIYYGGPLLLCNALLIQDKLWPYLLLNSFEHHFSPMERFLADAQNGLPAYSFIEPNFMCSSTYGPENDMHPAFAVTDTGAATNALYGDELINTVYNALLNSPDWESTLLIITFDEHGGCYDHFPVTPSPRAVSPDGVIIPPNVPGGSGFDFQRFGVRVPAVLVSPLIQPGTVCNTQFDHTSIIKTVSNRWLGGANLTARDLAAVDVSEVLTLTPPNVRTDKPTFTPIPPPPFKGCDGQPLSDLQRAMVAAAAQRLAHKASELLDLSQINTTDDATNALDEREARVLQAI
jgi:phospholipase C